jgi:transcriptional regulator with XRE-family HTH domain
MTPGALIRDARSRAGLTQAELARRIGTSQPVVARLESGSANPTLATLERALNATGHRLRLSAEPQPSGVDESLIRRHLALAPAERMASLESMYREARKLARAGESARGRVA